MSDEGARVAGLDLDRFLSQVHLAGISSRAISDRGSNLAPHEQCPRVHAERPENVAQPKFGAHKIGGTCSLLTHFHRTPLSVPRELNDGELQGSPADPDRPFVLSARECDGSPEPAIHPFIIDSSFNSRRPTLIKASRTEFYSVRTLNRRVSNPHCRYIDAGMNHEHRGHRDSARWNWFDRNHSAIERQQHAPIRPHLVVVLP